MKYALFNLKSSSVHVGLCFFFLNIIRALLSLLLKFPLSSKPQYTCLIIIPSKWHIFSLLNPFQYQWCIIPSYIFRIQTADDFIYDNTILTEQLALCLLGFQSDGMVYFLSKHCHKS